MASEHVGGPAERRDQLAHVRRAAIEPSVTAEARIPEVLTCGSVGVDLYPLQVGIPLEDVECFAKYLGGASANVAVATAQLGRRSAVLAAVGDDGFGRFARKALRRFGVSDAPVSIAHTLATPVTFCEIAPPDSFAEWSCRPFPPPLPALDDADLDVVRNAQLLWLSGTELNEETGAKSYSAVLEARAGQPITVLDLCHRLSSWTHPAPIPELVQEALKQVTVVVCDHRGTAGVTGEIEPDRAADVLLAAGAELVVVRKREGGALAKTRAHAVESPPAPALPTLNVLGAADAFGGALCHGLLAGWPLKKVLLAADGASAIVASRLESSTYMPTVIEIETLLGGGNPNEVVVDAWAMSGRSL